MSKQCHKSYSEESDKNYKRNLKFKLPKLQVKIK